MQILVLLGAVVVSSYRQLKPSNHNGPRIFCLRSLTKTILVMKLIILFLTLGFLQLSAKSVSQTVSFTGRDVPLEKVFSVVKTQTGYGFFFDKSLLETVKPISIEARNVDLNVFLDQLFKQIPLNYAIKNKTIVISKKQVPSRNTEDIAFAGEFVPVKGRVLDEGGNPIPGVTVRIKGTNNMTATNDRGEFSFEDLPANAVLVFTGANVETKEMEVKGRSDLKDISLKMKVALVEEVTLTVNTGYQSLSRERSAGSFAKPNMQILRNRTTSMNVLQRLDGLVPGLTLNNTFGHEPLLIRGLNSVNATRAPLIVVDGVPLGDVTSINPQDVADITILKDATASSIWGAKASNGVIVITTKKAGTNEKLRISYDGFVNFQGKPDLAYLNMMNSQQYIQTAREIFDPVTYRWNAVSVDRSSVPPHEMILYNQHRGLIPAAQASKSLDSLASINNIDQISELWYRPATLTNHTISLTSGGRVHSIYGSLSFTDNQSNRPGEQNRTYKVNLRQDFNLSKRIQLYLLTDLTNSTSSSARYANVNSGFYPYQLFRDENGNNLSMSYIGDYSDSVRRSSEDRSRIPLDYVPLNEVNLGSTNSDALVGRIVGGVTVSLLPGLRFQGVYGFLKSENKTTSYDDNLSFNQRRELVNFTVAATPAETPVYYLPVDGGKYSVSNTGQKEWTVRNQLIYDGHWNDSRHQLTLLAGHESQEQVQSMNQNTLRGYDPLLLTYASIDYAALSTTGVSNAVLNSFGQSILFDDAYSAYEFQNRFNSYYANGAYTYNRKYSVNGSWRIDQSNLFGLDKSAQNKPVWSAGVKWKISDEKFMSGSNFLNRLALRTTYGVTGNSPLAGTASSRNILSPIRAGYLPGGTGLSVSSAANRKLTWESTTTLNLGLDFSVFNNRFSGAIDLYQKKTDNLIGEMPVNTLTGFSTIVGNYGSLKNHGIELALSSQNVTKKNFSWVTSLNLAYNKNEITGLNYLTPITTGANLIGTRYYNGYPAFSVFAYQFAGLDELGDPRVYLSDKSITKVRNITKPGDIAFAGTSQAPWSGGLSNVFTYKNFNLSVNTIFNVGHVIRRESAATYFTSGRLIGSANLVSGNYNKIVLERWKKPGDEQFTSVPSYVSNSSISNSRRNVNYFIFGDVNVLDASYAKIRDITLSYSLPSGIISRMKVENLTFRAQVSNIMIWKANKYGIDPEFHGSNANRVLRTNQGGITLGAHLSF